MRVQQTWEEPAPSARCQWIGSRGPFNGCAISALFLAPPEITKLMVHLGARSKPRYKSTIVALTTNTESTDQPYIRALLKGAQQRADTLGYGPKLIRFEPGSGRNRALERILASRGIQGLLLLPMLAPISLGGLLDWSKFSVVAATNGVLAPEFSRVVPHHYGNTLSICRHLAELGYVRVGLVMKAQNARQFRSPAFAMKL